MNPREKVLAIVIGAAIVLGLGYKGVNILFIQRYNDARESLDKLKAENNRLDGILASRESLARRWLNAVDRTFSFEKSTAQGLFGRDLKELAKRHGFDDAVFATSSGTKIGRKTGISTVAHRITIQGKFDEIIAFLRDIYATPYLCQVTKLALSPLDSSDQRGSVKLEFIVESPLLPEIDKKEIPHVRGAKTMSPDPDQSREPARKYVKGDECYEALTHRNILRPYLPPPPNIVLIDNKDFKTVFLEISFFWDGEVNEKLVESVAGKSTLPVKGKGDIVEIVGSYADGEAFGPKRIVFDDKKKDRTYVVASHTPPPPPTVVDLAVNNRHNEAIYLDIITPTKDDPLKVEPTMVFETGVSDVREYKDVESVMVTARYASGVTHSSQTFKPGLGKQTYDVPPEPAEQVAHTSKPDVRAIDAPPNPKLTVTALLTYPDVDELWTQEMIVTDGRQRKIIRAGEEGAVDDGTLLAVVPTLGGVVKMPESGNYYIYPLGRKFTERVKLEAEEDADLPAAIDAWTRR